MEWDVELDEKAKKVVNKIAISLIYSVHFSLELNDLKQAGHLAVWKLKSKNLVSFDEKFSQSHRLAFIYLNVKSAILELDRTTRAQYGYGRYVYGKLNKEKDFVFPENFSDEISDKDLIATDNPQRCCEIRKLLTYLDKFLSSKKNNTHKNILANIIDGKSLAETSMALNLSPARISQVIKEFRELINSYLS